MVRIRIPGSVPLANGSGSGVDLSPDPTTFFNDLKDLIITKFSYFFITNPQYIIFSLLNTLLGKVKDPDPDPYL